MKLTSRLLPALETGSPHVMLVIHGLGDSMAGYAWLPDVLNLPWMNYLFVNAPDTYYGGYSWFDFSGDPKPGIQRSHELLCKTLAEAGFAAENTFIFGFSQGCLMTIELGVRYPARLAGCIGISGMVVEPHVLLKKQSPVAHQQKFLLTHGTHDPLLALAGARIYVQQLKDANLQVEYMEFAKAHDIAGEPEINLIRNFLVKQAGKTY